MCMRYSVGMTAGRVDYGVVQWVKRSTLRWFGHVMRMNEDDSINEGE